MEKKEEGKGEKEKEAEVATKWGMGEGTSEEVTGDSKLGTSGQNPVLKDTSMTYLRTTGPM